MKYYGKSKEVLQKILEAFQSGNIAEPLALSLLPADSDRPFDRWSISNKVGVLLMGCQDARTYRQWQDVDRQVIKGQKAHAFILCPILYPEDKDDPDAGMRLTGLKTKAVFDVSQTEGEPLSEEGARLIDALPLKNVAKHWGVNIVDGRQFGAAGSYRPSTNTITLSTTNLKTWLHELMHKADDEIGSLKERGQHWRSEIVADLGAVTLAHMIGREPEADEGRCWDYIQHYAQEAKKEPIACCQEVLDRIAKVINFILETADLIEEGSC